MGTDDIIKARRIHFVGIGGIGVSAIARMMLEQGKQVTGSDRDSSSITEQLQMLGAKVFIGHDPVHVPEDADLVVYSPAIPTDNLEMRRAKELGIPLFSYPQALGLISKERFTVAVAGTHGKTTTTAMIAKILEGTEVDPTVIVGSLLKGSESNFLPGAGPHFIVEACEYKRSFLYLFPNILVVTNIDTDHLDYYRDLADIQHAFQELVEKVPGGGFVVCNPEDENTLPVLTNNRAQITDYMPYLDHVSDLPVPGEHNKFNAAAALAVAYLLGADLKMAKKKLESYEGTWRRFDYRGTSKEGVEVYDDYAHHPTEIKATLVAFREKFPKQRIVVVFQPHLYSRTKLLFDQFAQSFVDADRVVVLPIYAAREKPDPNISSEKLVGAMSKHHDSVAHAKDFTDAASKLRGILRRGDVLVTIGAGDIYKVGEALMRNST